MSKLFDPPVEPLVAKGVGRVAGNSRELSVIFNRELTDDEMRIIHDVLRSSLEWAQRYSKVSIST